jgi:beta-lactamase superfamily II metal-dependent hydrolase
MKAKKSARKSARRANGNASAAGNIALRMYNVGFGDCFLLRIPTNKGERRVLIDCGFHSQGKGKFSDSELVTQIKTDLNGEGLDVVVATHRHQDHISGFGETNLWADIPVEEVWLPFTADPDAAADEPALKAWNALMESAHGLWDSTATNLTTEAAAALGARDPEERDAAAFMLWNARANAPGIKNLLHDLKRKDGRPGDRRFLPNGRDYPSQFETANLPGVKIHVLGPPKDPKFRRQMKVPSSWGFGVGTVDLGGAATQDTGSPFSPEWRISKLPPSKPFYDSTLQSIRLFNDDLLYAAKALDGFLNGESLVLLLEIGNARLLFPGDAEVGAWTTILNDAKALALVSSASFVKIGHHGSHNATPIVFVTDHLASKIPAIISTQEGPGKYRNGIPLQSLLDAMTTRKMSFARSDKPPKTKNGIFKPEPNYRWIDCLIPVLRQN